MTRRNKAMSVNYNELQKFDDIELQKYELTARQAAILLAQTVYIGWTTRWKNLPTLTDIKQIRDDINNQLMSPVECEVMTPEEICAIVAECQTIIDIQSDISQNEANNIANAEDIATNTSDIATLQNDVSLNTANIATNTANIATNTSDIADNADEISNLWFDAAQQAALINNNITRLDDIETLNTAQQAELDDHETRITTLENASGGSGDSKYVLIDSWLAEDSAQQEAILTIDERQYSYFKIFASVVATNTGARYLAMECNEDDTATNYGSSEGSTLLGRIGQNLAFGDDMTTSIETFVHAPQRADVFKVFASQLKFQDKENGNFFQTTSTLVWENTDAIEELKFYVSGGGHFGVGSRIEIYGFLDDTEPPITYDWEARYTLTSDMPNPPFVHNGVYNSGNNAIEVTDIAGNEEATVILTTASSHDYAQVGLLCYIAATGSNVQKIISFDGTTADLLSDTVPTNTVTEQVFAWEKTTDDVRLTLRINEGSGDGIGEIYEIIWRGYGTIPPELAAYEI